MNLRNILLCAAASVALLAGATAHKYSYDTIPGDPMKVKMYTLPNGLKLFMSVNKDRPRIQTNIAVRVGGKNDPAATTGLAHYFEHLMFKGTPIFGTTDYAAEKPMLDAIEALFEQYRVTSDSTARARIYHTIDSISYQASLLAIPNEYDKLMSAIGSTGTNAYTGNDMTCYVENIPSNQVENWARIQAVRFKEPVLRGFHTELETIYEEKNMSLTDDFEKTYMKLFALLFPHHPYGTQTVLGSQEHLKNPSITNVKEYHKKWYVPNNMAIVMSGDFDPDAVTAIIERYFGDMQPNAALEPMAVTPEAPITTPLKADVTGLESESLMLGWRFDGAASAQADTLAIIDYLLNNGKAGLIDININQAQKALSAGSGTENMADYSAMLMLGSPKEGQSLDEVREMLLAQVALLREGQFDERTIQSTINNLKLSEQSALESNDARVDAMVGAFINGIPWEREVGRLDRLAKITKTDVVDFARRHLRDDNYAIVYKLQGRDSTIVKMPKPQLTPIATNRDTASEFLTEIQNSKVVPIEPVFVDFSRDLDILDGGTGGDLLYKKNDSDSLFVLTYVFETGTGADRLLSVAPGYLSLLGTSQLSTQDIKSRLYELACSYSISSGNDRTYITIHGLSENMPEAMSIVEALLDDAQPDAETWELYKDRIFKDRENDKAEQARAFQALNTYAFYGPELVQWQLSNTELEQLAPSQLTESVKSLREYPHRVIYYGPLSADSLKATLKARHYTAESPAKLPQSRTFLPKRTPTTQIYLAPYDSNQIYLYMMSNNGETFNVDIEPLRSMYNTYFGGDMSSIVFQEMRESRSLAYSASAGYSGVSRLDRPYTYNAFIATQNDKMMDAIGAFYEIINNMPQSEAAFRIAKDATDTNLRTNRVIKDDVAWSYIRALDLGLDSSLNKRFYDELPSITLERVTDFQQHNVKDRTYTIAILGRIEDLDLDALRALGEVTILTPEQTFGY